VYLKAKERCTEENRGDPAFMFPLLCVLSCFYFFVCSVVPFYFQREKKKMHPTHMKHCVRYVDSLSFYKMRRLMHFFVSTVLREVRC